MDIEKRNIVDAMVMTSYNTVRYPTSGDPTALDYTDIQRQAAQ